MMKNLYFILPIILISLSVVSFFVLLKSCQEENLNLELYATPKAGLEPLTVDIRLQASSNQRIKSLKLDIDGDGRYDIERSPSSGTFSLQMTHTYSVPQTYADSEFTLQIYARAEGERKIVERTEIIRVFPKKNFEFSVVASICSGPPPLEVIFQVFISSCDLCTFSMDCNGDGKYEFSQGLTQFTCKFEEEGLYPSKVSVSDGRGNFSVSEFFYCGLQSQSRIARFIEVLSKLSLESILYNPQTLRILDVFYDSKLTEYIALSAPKSIIILKDRRIVDIFGYDVIYSAPTFAKFFKEQNDVSLYFSSEYGTFRWANGVTEKLSDRRLLMLYPKQSSYIILDHIRQTYGFCLDEKLESCQELPLDYLGFHSNVKSYDSYLLISNRLPPTIILMKIDDFPNYQTFGQVDSIYTYDYFPPYLLFVIPQELSDYFQLINLYDGESKTYQTPDPLRIKFISGAFLDAEKLILGTSEFPCEFEEKVIKSCNKLIFNTQKDRFENLEGKGEIKDTLRQGGNVLLLHNQGLDSISVLSSGSYKISNYYLPGLFGDFLYDGKNLYIASQNIVSVFVSENGKIKFTKYFEIPVGTPVAVHKSGNILIIGIPDDLSTDLNEGKIVIIDLNENKVSKIINDRVSVVMCAYIKGDKIFVCDNNKVVIFSISGEKIGELGFTEDVKDLYITNDGILYVISDIHLFTLVLGGNTSEIKDIVDIKDTVMQFFKIDVDEKRKLLFSAEGQDHTFRIFDVSNVIPQELTRVSIDYGTYNDIAIGITHFENFLFVSSSYVGLMMFDISDPLKPLIRKKTYFEDYSLPVEKCFIDKFSIVCSSLGSILFIR